MSEVFHTCHTSAHDPEARATFHEMVAELGAEHGSVAPQRGIDFGKTQMSDQQVVEAQKQIQENSHEQLESAIVEADARIWV